MTRLRAPFVVSLVLGLLIAIPGAAQITRSADPGELGIAITINKLELTTSQMQQVHDILVGILSEVSELKDCKQAFTEEMIEFTGDSTELEAALSGFKAEMKVETEKLQETVQQALDDLKGLLTIEQGEILRSALMQSDNMGLMERRAVAMARRRNWGLDFTDRDRAISDMQQGEGIQERSGNSPEWLEQMKANHPQLADKMANRWASRSSESLGEKFGSRLDLQELGNKKTILGRAEGGRLLELLEQVVDILDTKLQSLQ